MQCLLDLAFINQAAPSCIDTIKLLNQEAFELFIIIEFKANNFTVSALIDVFIILRYKGVQEDFVIQCIDGSLFLLFLQAEKGSKNAVFDSPVDKYSHLFFRQCPILYSKHIPSENI